MENNLFINLLNKTWKLYFSAKRWLIIVFKDSMLFPSNRAVDFFGSSRIVHWFMLLYTGLEKRIIIFFKDSQIAFLTAALRNKFHIMPIKAGSIVLIISVLTNILLSIACYKEIVLSAWILNGLLLFLGLAGLSSDANWKDARKNSIILNRVFK